MQQVEVQALPLEPLSSLLAPGRAQLLAADAARARTQLAERVVWNVNATAHGGGVAEMLQSLLAYGRGAGVDTRWLVLDGNPEFFAITKRLHNALHGVAPGPDGLGEAEHQVYRRVLADNAALLAERVRPADIVMLHDPQTAGLVEAVRAMGAHVVWRCHIGRDDTDPASEQGWAFLRGYLQGTDAFVFSRRRYVPDWVPGERVRVIPPSIDPFAAKNRELQELGVDRVLRQVGLIDGDGPHTLEFTRRDGTSGSIRAHDDLLRGSAPPPAEAPLVVQVSRWDRLKDMAGVLAGFVAHVAPRMPEVHLMLAGPDVAGVSDDPEGAEVFAEALAAWQRLPDAVRERCHLVAIPIDDVDENAIIVNALQRHAAVVVQKSLVEGFGLTVTEAMWKSRPVLASAVGGIQDQITDQIDGVLLPDPTDLAGYGDRLRALLDDPARAAVLGQAARERVRGAFLGDRHLIQYADLFADLIGD